MLQTLIILAENKVGVLARVALVFRRRGFNIDWLSVGRTERPEVARLTITVNADPDQTTRIEADLCKLVNVIRVENVSAEPSLVRGLAMIRVSTTRETRSQVLELATIFRARVIEVAPESLAIEITGTEDKFEALLEVLQPFGLLDMVRSGIVALRRGTRTEKSASDQTPTCAQDDLSQSV
jgi:acetolactate synthase I/III small subunit